MPILRDTGDADNLAGQNATAHEMRAHRLWPVVAAVPDPEMPPLTIADLGILRSVDEMDGRVVVTITPTYSGCPAVEYIEDLITEAVTGTGVAADQVEVRRELSPAWSTDWITAAGREKLEMSGISPPRTLLDGTHS